MSDPLIPSAASSWTKTTLEALNASFDRHHVHEFTFDGLAMPSDLEQQINTIAQAFTSVNNSNRITPKFIFNRSSYPQLVNFRQFYRQLSLIISRDGPLIHGPLDPPSPPTQIASPFVPTTPPSSANPVDPQYSGSSGAESKDEHYTDLCAYEFVRDSYEVLEDALQQHAWYRETDYQLQQIVTAESDGGFSLQPNPALRCMYPVFSIETKRKKHQSRNNDDAYQRHAAQIYAEMLGQVCHQTLYQNSQMYQEAFILHARHATFYLFYAKFPNAYLRDIAKYGSRYRQAVRDPQRIIIQQSRPFRMRIPEHQSQFFQLFANLLYYLVSGNSHVFHLASDENNRFYRAVMGLNKPAIYETIRVFQVFEPDGVLDAEGPLDEEGNFSERQSMHQRTDSGSVSTDSARWSTTSNVGSPMDTEGL